MNKLPIAAPRKNFTRHFKAGKIYICRIAKLRAAGAARSGIS